jgi:rhamnosyltransferase
VLVKVEGNMLVSVVIPVKNGDYWLKDTLNAIFRQKIDGSLEVIVIDSGSTDKSLEIVGQYPVRLVKIDSREFNHGLTRNLGAQLAEGEFVTMTVQDAMPCDEYWLQRLLDGFVDENVAGVCGQQVVPHHTDKNPISWFRPQSEPAIRTFRFTPAEFESLSPDMKRQVCSWDDVTAMYRKAALMQVPFQKVSFAEDVLWAKHALLKGYTLVYNTAARVYHYHHYPPEQVVKRVFTEYFHFYKFFGSKPIPVANGLTRKLKDVRLLLSEGSLSVADKWKWYRYNQRIRKELNHAVKLFHQSLAQGEEELEAMHERLCDGVQASKPVSV